MKYLYCYKKFWSSVNDEKTVGSMNVKIFTPKLKKLSLFGEPKNIKSIVVRLLFQLTTKGKAKIYYVAEGDDLKHTSYVVPQCNKFPFLGENDFEIGPCYTYEKHRGKGIYPKVLRFICSSLGNNDTTFYMIVDESNVASVKGIEKAGFKKCGIIEVTKYTKRYKLVQSF